MTSQSTLVVLRKFLLARWGAPTQERVRVVLARDARDAARQLSARVLDLPHLDAALAVTDDAEWLVLEADGSQTHGDVWAGFHARERAYFVSGWFRLRCG